MIGAGTAGYIVQTVIISKINNDEQLGGKIPDYPDKGVGKSAVDTQEKALV